MGENNTLTALKGCGVKRERSLGPTLIPFNFESNPNRCLNTKKNKIKPLCLGRDLRSPSALVHIYLFIWILTLLSTQCTGHITTGSFMGRGNQYMQLVKVLYSKLPTNSKQLPAFPLEVRLGTEPQSQRWEARVLPLCHRGPLLSILLHLTEQQNSNLVPFTFNHSNNRLFNLH